MSEPEKVCDKCPHTNGPHLLVATTGDPRDGGVRLCHVKGCLCFATWSIPQLGSTKDSVTIPSMSEIEEMRATLQTEPV